MGHEGFAMAVQAERPRRLFTVDEYHSMAAAGIFGPEERVELIDGEIIQMSPIGPRHAGCVINLTRLLVTRLGDRAVISPDVLLAVEVADTTARFDRIIKARLYARSRIAEYWLVDVGSARVDIFRTPSGDAYADATQVGRGGTVASLAFPDVVIAVDELLA
jgi:Uma2 family endonuclease